MLIVPEISLYIIGDEILLQNTKMLLTFIICHWKCANYDLIVI